MALQFCSGKKSVLRNAYKLPLVLTAKNAGVAQSSVGVTHFRFMNKMKTHTSALYVNQRHIGAWSNKTPQLLHFIVWWMPDTYF